ncbi:MAG: response regulator transcription factor [Gammaproteobacteria bacterium]|nr:response regulator transcription factor [Gammaproteobacteria bacterium]MCI0590998.1 response regulator transcription factor [Gammaproteobacteria bacterium]
MIRLLIADDHPIVREGLKRIVAECRDMRVVGEAVNGDEALTKSKSAGADVLLLDVSMPGPGFLDVMRLLRAESPGLRVLVLSVHPEDHYAVRALRAGAAGYLTKDHSPEELANAIRRVHAGGKYVTASLAEQLASELGPDAEKPPHETLSDREHQVFCMLGSGKSVNEIATELTLSPKTVSTYRTRILQKMKLRNNTELIRYAVQNALVD